MGYIHPWPWSFNYICILLIIGPCKLCKPAMTFCCETRIGQSYSLHENDTTSACS
jgi:hypothetical protein